MGAGQSPARRRRDMMAAFSSRGPLGDFIKPDVTAPGVQVLAGMTPQPDQTTADNGPPGNLYQAIAGTSMSSPHSAGVSALVKAAHPDWTPGDDQVRSDDLVGADGRQGGRRHAGRPVRHGRRLDPCRPRGQPDARLRRDVRRLRRAGERSAASDRPQHRERGRDDDDRLDHDEADGDNVSRQGSGPGGLDRGPGRRRRSSSPTRPKPQGPRRSEERQQDPSEEERDDGHLDHDQRSGGGERPVLRSDHARSRRRRRERGHDPGRIRQEAGHRHADAHCTPTTSRRRPGPAHCTRRVANFGSRRPTST